MNGLLLALLFCPKTDEAPNGALDDCPNAPDDDEEVPKVGAEGVPKAAVEVPKAGGNGEPNVDC